MTGTYTTAAEAAHAAAEAVRTLNHLTLAAGVSPEWEMPSDAYDVVAALRTMAAGLPQSIEQVQHLVDGLENTGRLRHDSGDRARLDADLYNLRAATGQAATMAGLLARVLADAHNDLSAIGYEFPDGGDEQ